MTISADRTTKRFRRIVRFFCAALCALALFSVSPGKAANPLYPIEIQNISFSGGIGRGMTSAGADYVANCYYRGYGLPGTAITLTASMKTGSGFTSPMYGAVMFTVSYSDGATTNSFNVTIPSGSHTATAEIPYTFSGIASTSTTKWIYTVSKAEGDYTDPLVAPIQKPGLINYIYWNNKNTLDSAVPGVPVSTVTQSSFTPYWAPVDTRTNDPVFGEDFYEYRIYYRESGTSTYKQWNGANDATLRGLSSNPYPPAVSSTTHFAIPVSALIWKYTSISGLKPFTTYEYYIAAADVFGNEAPITSGGTSAAPRSVITLPHKLTATISDGISTYSDFSNLATPTLRTLRETNIRVDIYTVTTKAQPDLCRIWFTSAAGNMVSGSAIDTSLTPIDSVAAVRTGSNKWTAYLPTSTSAVIRDANTVRFLVQLTSAGVSNLVDRDSSADPNTAPWNFCIAATTRFSPYPTRVLNNVLTASDPIAYPSYYLTEDAYVTIKVYDIKGRPVTTVLDSAFRRGGINIKERGWDGSNKSNKKLGVGLYYMIFRAKSAANGREILNDTKKIVMRH